MRHHLGRLFLLLSALFAYTGFTPVYAGAPKAFIEEPVKGEHCVEDERYMRRNHMELLKHHRDKTVHEGIRTKQHSLKECINCHAGKQTGSVTASKENFCVSCHSYAAVKIDCFDCHSSKPQGPMTMHPLNAETAHYRHNLDAEATSNVRAEDEDKAGVAR